MDEEVRYLCFWPDAGIDADIGGHGSKGIQILFSDHDQSAREDSSNDDPFLPVDVRGKLYCRQALRAGGIAVGLVDNRGVSNGDHPRIQPADVYRCI